MKPTLFCLPAGPATAAYSHSETLSEEANRDPGAGAAGPQLGHSGGCPSLLPNTTLTPQGALQSKQPDLGGPAPKTGTFVGLAQSSTESLLKMLSHKQIKMEWDQVAKLRQTVNETGEGSP